MALLLAVHALAAAPMLANGGVFWDSWMLYWDGVEGNWAHLARWFGDSGKPQLYVFHRALLSLPDFVGVYRWASFAALLAAPLLFWAGLRETGLLGEAQCLRAALLAGTCPALVVGHAMVLLPYLVSVTLFLGAALLLLRASRGAPPRLGEVRVLLALGLLLASFTISSLLPFFFGVWAAWLLAGAHRRGLSLRRELAAGRGAYAVAFALPFAAFSLEKLLLPARGWFRGYNAVRFSPEVLGDLARALLDAFAAPAARTATLLAEAPALAGLAVLGAAAVSAVVAHRGGDRHDAAPSRPGPVIAFALGWLILALLPYAAVGKAAEGSLWDSRHVLLVGFPLGLLLSAGLAALARLGAGRAVVAGAAGLLVAAFALTQLRVQLAWLERSIADAAIVCALRQQPAAGESIFWVRNHSGLGPGERYTNFEWSSLLKAAWGGDRRLGLSADGFGERQMRMLRRKIDQGHRPMLRDVDLSGAHAVLEITAAEPRMSSLRALAAGAPRGPRAPCTGPTPVRVALRPAPPQNGEIWAALLQRTARPRRR